MTKALGGDSRASRRIVWVHLQLVLAVALATATLSKVAWSAESAPSTEQRIQAIIPELEAYVQSGMKAFDVPGVAIGIVNGDKLIYAKGFGVRSRNGGAPVDTKTLFQIGSTTKAFLATSIGIMVDRGKLRWDDRIADLHPDFQLMDPWVTREFRLFDLLAQRSGLPPYVNDVFGMLGIDETTLVRSLRYVEPVTSFRTTFAYTNVTHFLAGQVVAKAAGLPDGDTVIQKELLEPLGMKDTSWTVEAVMAATNRAEGHRWTPEGSIAIPFTQVFPYDFHEAGDINSNVEDMARWVRLQLANGVFEGRRLVSAEVLAFTRTPKVASSEKAFYAYGWMEAQTPNGTAIFHTGSTLGFGTLVGLLPDKDVGVIVLSNEEDKGLPVSVGVWFLDRVLGNPKVDYAAQGLKAATEAHDKLVKLFTRPENPTPASPLASLAGAYSHPGLGKAAVKAEGDALIVELEASGAKLKLEPWNGDVFVVRYVPEGRFADVAAGLGPMPLGFVQFQIDKDDKLNRFRFINQDNGQPFDFKRE